MKFKTHLQRNRTVFPLKWLFLLIFTIYFQVGRSQNQKVTLSGDSLTLRSAFNQIEKQTKMTIDYEAYTFDTNKKISNSIKTAKLSDMLSKLLLNTNCDYIIQDSHIVITPIKTKLDKRKVTGLVLDESGNPLIGVSVKVEGISNNTTTDVNGQFHLNIDNRSTIVVSYIGYETSFYKVGKELEFKIILKENTKLLTEVIVVGFGTQKKANLTGAVATVAGKDLEARPVTNIGQALQGMVPGLNISRSGDLGGGLESRPNISIRGLATIGDGSTGNPLILIDGMEGDINALNPNDVENISVLKDIAASSIYGSRAPFGVILVTTKKGKAGRSQINYNGNLRSNSPISMPKQMDSYSFANYVNTARLNGNETVWFDNAEMQRILDFQQGKLGKETIIAKGDKWGDGYENGNDNVDWFNTIYRSSAPSQEHSMSFSGGGDKMTYYLSGEYMGQEGLMKLNQDTYNRYTLNVKINAKLTNWASIVYSARFSREDFNRPTALTNSLYDNMARQAWPTLPLYDPNGYLYSSPSPALAIQDGGQDKGQTDWNYQQLNLKLEPTTGWTIQANLNYKIGDGFRHWDVIPTYNHDVAGKPYYAFQQWYFPNDPNPNVHEQAERTNFFSPNVYSDYAKSFGKNNIKVMAGFQSELNKYRSLGVTRIGVMVPEYPIIDITSGTSPDGKIVAPTISGRYEEWSTMGYFGRINYDYDGRYLVEANLRYDGTSRYRENMRWNYFPSVSLGWNVAREEFWRSLENTVNLFKFRGSYGTLGNQNTRELYPTYQTTGYEASKGSWLINNLNTSRSWAPGLVSSVLGWETVRSWNAGADLGLFNNRLSTSFDYYVRYTDNMVGAAPALPAILGQTPPKTNNTDLTTRGWELSVAWQDRLKNGLGYTVNFMLSDSRSEITRYPNNPTVQLDKFYPGQQWGEIWGYTTLGVAKTQEEMDAHLETLANGGQNVLGSNWVAGDVMYKDVNGDGKIDKGANTLGDHGDLSVIGNNTPRYLFGLDISADWKGLDFRTFFQGVLKRDYWQGSNMFFGACRGSIWDVVAFEEHADYFRPEPTADELADPTYVSNPLGANLDGYYPRPLFNGKNTETQTRYLQNASYIRLKNVQFGYTIPGRISRKMLIEKCRIYASGENLWTGTKLSSIFDPESIDSGRGGNAYPLSKVYSVGLSVTF